MQPAKWYPRAIAAGLYCGERANEGAVRALTTKCRPGLSTQFHLERARDARTARKHHSRRGQRAAGCRNQAALSQHWVAALYGHAVCGLQWRAGHRLE